MFDSAGENIWLPERCDDEELREGLRMRRTDSRITGECMKAAAWVSVGSQQMKSALKSSWLPFC